MAKELPYFQFEPEQWDNGNIQMLSRSDKGLFIDLCCLYWARLGSLPIKLAVRKLCDGNANAFDSLIEEDIIYVENDCFRVDFLDEQLQKFEEKSKTNAKSANARWKKHRKQKALEQAQCERNANASKTHNERNAIREENRIEDKMKERGSPAENAFDFLVNMGSSKFEAWMMQNKSQVHKWDKMILDYNDTAEMEKLDYDFDVLFGRLKKYCRNWISNQSQPKFSKTEKIVF